MQKETDAKQKRIQFILIAVVLALFAFSVIAILLIKMTAGKPGYVCIYRDNALVEKIDLSKVKESYTLTINGENGGVNIVEIRPDGVAIIDANCPDKLCVNMGFITDSIMPITCLPNHIVVKLEGVENKETEGIDGIVW